MIFIFCLALCSVLGLFGILGQQYCCALFNRERFAFCGLACLRDFDFLYFKHF